MDEMFSSRNGHRVDTEVSLERGGISVVTESRRRSSNLLVSKVNSNDAGNYTCAPSNALPDSVMVHVILGNALGEGGKGAGAVGANLMTPSWGKRCRSF